MSGIGGVSDTLISSGVAGLDDVLSGGLHRNRSYMLEGVPGSGKTTLALQFVRAGASRREPVLYVTLSETDEELRAVAKSHGWDLDGVTHARDHAVRGGARSGRSLTMFHPSEVELAATTQQVIADIEQSSPDVRGVRFVVRAPAAGRKPAPVSAADPGAEAVFQSARGVHGATARRPAPRSDDDTAHAEHRARRDPARAVEPRVRRRSPPAAGASNIVASRFAAGITTTRSAPAVSRSFRVWSRPNTASQPLAPSCKSGITEIDRAAWRRHRTGHQHADCRRRRHRQIDAGRAVRRRGRGAWASASALFIFDESPHTLLDAAARRSASISRRHVENGAIAVKQVDPAELSPGEFTHAIRTAVEQDGVKLVVIDSLNGYLNAMPEERFLAIQLHELLTYLGQQQRGDDSDVRPPGTARRADDRRRSTPAIWPMP